jgi:hypothetical protein
MKECCCKKKENEKKEVARMIYPPKVGLVGKYGDLRNIRGCDDGGSGRGVLVGRQGGVRLVPPE